MTTSNHVNGNGHALARAATNGNPHLNRRTLAVDPASTPVEELMKPPAWLQSLRDAMSSSIKGSDLQDIMAQQVAKAKAGDMKAASFVMSQAHKLMENEMKRPISITQNNYYDTPSDARPDVPLQPGDDETGKDLKKLSARARAGVPLTGRPGDARIRPVSDEEEKELRRRQQEQEDDDAGDPLRD